MREAKEVAEWLEEALRPLGKLTNAVMIAVYVVMLIGALWLKGGTEELAEKYHCVDRPICYDAELAVAVQARSELEKLKRDIKDMQREIGKLR